VTLAWWLLLALSEPSQLWGWHGELFDPAGRLPDVSFAGYHGGERSIPEGPVVATVRNFGAVGDGVADDTAAFQRAVDTSTGVVLVPRGRYRLESVVRLRKSDVVLRGDGDAVLVMPNSLADLYGPAVGWSWDGGLLRVQPPSGPITTVEVTSRGVRGARGVTVTSTAGLAPGLMVQLELMDDERGTLGRHLHNNQAASGTCSYQVPLRFRWPVRIASISGREVIFAQPTRTDVRAQWQPRLRLAPYVEEVGIERLRIAFPEVPYAGHHNEPGYNAILMTGGVADSWVRDVVIDNADNGVFIAADSKNITIDGLRLEGRWGHHGVVFSFAHDSLLTNWHEATNFVHAVTVTHRASGNVIKNGSADFEIEMDHHRDSPFANVFSTLSSTASFRSSGSPCAGQHSGARSTFWGLEQLVWLPSWGHVQANVVGPLPVPDRLTDDREWYEHVPTLEPADLHAAQLARRLAPRGTPLEERTEARWFMAGDRLFLGTSRYREAEWALLAETRGDGRLSAEVQTAEVLAWNPSANLILIIGFVDPLNYDYAMFAAEPGGLFRVRDGVSTQLAVAAPALVDERVHVAEIERAGDELTMLFDGVVVARAQVASRPGRAGVGSVGDAAWFANLRLDAPRPEVDAGIADSGPADGAYRPSDALPPGPVDARVEDASVAPADAGAPSSAPVTTCACRTHVPADDGLGRGIALLLAVALARRRRAQ